LKVQEFQDEFFCFGHKTLGALIGITLTLDCFGWYYHCNMIVF
jgi:hypothetical protein